MRTQPTRGHSASAPFRAACCRGRSSDRMAARAQDLDWFTDIEMDGRTLPEHEAAIARLPGKLVIDHIGKFLEPVPLDHPAVAALMRLVDSGAHLREDRLAL